MGQKRFPIIGRTNRCNTKEGGKGDTEKRNHNIGNRDQMETIDKPRAGQRVPLRCVSDIAHGQLIGIRSETLSVGYIPLMTNYMTQHRDIYLPAVRYQEYEKYLISIRAVALTILTCGITVS